ncbi:hypothetical protein [Methylobrevis albus]|uniref:Uncharacterized protein n=1 Tax=Methylobrevis albus TaxID=2793297 RepID=A0A931MZ72_9HYPH|nr:hypothetical protein [Methylobrevis albus]MBH0239182.1 hypothetical protein [Methylobrevis albus]
MSDEGADKPGRRSAPKPGLRSRGMLGAPAVTTVRPGETAGQGADRPAPRAKGSVAPSPTVAPLVPDRRGGEG